MTKLKLLSKSLVKFIFLFGIGIMLHFYSFSQCYYAHSILGENQSGFSENLSLDDFFGADIDTLGDLNGDGIMDLIVGADGDEDGPAPFPSWEYENGAVYILFMNADNTVQSYNKLSYFDGLNISAGDAFGTSVAGIGDVDGDGVPDAAVGSVGDDDGYSRNGSVTILFLNTNGTVKGYQKISDTQGGFTAPFRTDPYGRAWYFGFYQPPGGDRFGASVKGVGDMDGDGVPDITASADGNNNGGSYIPGYMYIIYLNSNGTVKNYRKIGDGFSGFSVPGYYWGPFSIPSFGDHGQRIPDMDGDGIDDMLVACERFVVSSSYRGAFFILYMNANGTVKDHAIVNGGVSNFEPESTFFPSSFFSDGMVPLGDIDGDGTLEVAANCNLCTRDESSEGIVFIISINGDGTVETYGEMSSFNNFGDGFDMGDQMGISLMYLGDNDNDGYNTLAIGNPERNQVYFVEFQYDDGEITYKPVCPTNIVNTIAASEPTACVGDLVAPINNVDFDVQGESAAFDGLENALFQWQWSQDNSIWEDLADATTLNYTDTEEFSSTVYFRRRYISCCLDTSFSNVVTITPGGIAPEANVVPQFYCPGAGGSGVMNVTVTGGIGPFTYSWSPTGGLSDPNIMNPTVTYEVSDLYELTVTGADGCEATAYAVMIPKQADASEENTVFLCNPTGVQIGTTPIPSEDILYSWSPATGLSCTNCPQPIANPSSNTTYTLTISDGMGCTNTDQVTVDVSGYEADAGPDIYVCQGTDTQVGTLSQSGITYGWAPGFYLDDQTIAQPTFFSGIRPDPNPYVYELTTFDAAADNCYSVDTLLAHVVWADGGADDTLYICNTPTEIGTPDCCNGQATYEWTILSGDANSFYDTLTNTFSNTSNEVMPFVMPTTQLTTYQVRVTWGPNPDNTGGASCTDIRVIGVSCGSGGCPLIDVSYEGGFGENCAIVAGGTEMKTWDEDSQYGLNPFFYTFNWTPATNLSCTDCPNPQFVSDITSNMVYRLDYTSLVTGASCFLLVNVFESNRAIPQANVNTDDGVVCSGNGVYIGDAPVVGWSYSWSPSDGLDDPTSSNPYATPAQSTDYTLTVTDDVTGCSSDTTVSVILFELAGVTGDYTTLCNGSSLQLGRTPVTGYSYSWSPTTGLDNPNIAQPTTTTTSDIIYTVTVTTLSGCTYTESVPIDVVNNFSINAPDVGICQGENGFLSASVSDVDPTDLQYSWSPTTNMVNPNSPTPMVSGLTTNRTYTVTVTSGSGGCVSTASVDVTINPLPTASLSNVDLCNTPVTIGPSPLAGYDYSWTPSTGLSSTEAANPTSSATSTTNYTLTIATPQGCEESFTQTVNVLAPDIDAGSDLRICEGNTVTIGDASVEAGATYSWSPTTNVSNTTAPQTNVNPTTTTTYTLTGDIGGCTSTDEVTIIVDSGPDISSDPLQSFTVMCRGTCQDIGVNENPLYTYQWLPASAVDSPNSATTSICLDSSQALDLVITDPSTGCSRSQEIFVFVVLGCCSIESLSPNIIAR